MEETIANSEIFYDFIYAFDVVFVFASTSVHAPPFSLSLLITLSVSWEKLAEGFTKGEILGYNINMVSEQSPQQDVPVMMCSKVFLFSAHFFPELSYGFIWCFLNL